MGLHKWQSAQLYASFHKESLFKGRLTAYRNEVRINCVSSEELGEILMKQSCM